MNRTQQAGRVAASIAASLALAVMLGGCTIVSTLAAGPTQPTTTSTSTSTPSPTETATATATETATTSPTPGGDTSTDSRAGLEEWLADWYNTEYSVLPTVTCDVAAEFEVYEGLIITCTATEPSGTAYTLLVEVTDVDNANQQYYMDITRS